MMTGLRPLIKLWYSLSISEGPKENMERLKMHLKIKTLHWYWSQDEYK